MAGGDGVDLEVTTVDMPTPTAQSYFGLAKKPLTGTRGYFPSSNPWAVNFSGYSPLEELETQQLADAYASSLQGDYSSPSGVAGLQRMVASGAIQPQQARAISSLGKTGFGSNEVAQGLQELFLIPTDHPQADVMRRDVYSRYPGLFTDPRAMQMIASMNRKKPQQTLTPTQSNRLQQAYAVTNRGITDEEKISAFKKVHNRAPKTDAEWSQAYRFVEEPRKSNLAAQMKTIEAAGGQVPAGFRQQAPQTSEKMTVKETVAPAQGKQSGIPTVNSVSELKSLNLPSGSFFRTPNGEVRQIK